MAKGVSFKFLGFQSKQPASGESRKAGAPVLLLEVVVEHSQVFCRLRTARFASVSTLMLWNPTNSLVADLDKATPDLEWRKASGIESARRLDEHHLRVLVVVRCAICERSRSRTDDSRREERGERTCEDNQVERFRSRFALLLAAPLPFFESLRRRLELSIQHEEPPSDKNWEACDKERRLPRARKLDAPAYTAPRPSSPHPPSASCTAASRGGRLRGSRRNLLRYSVRAS